jgi:hypothetical protein
MISVRLLKRRKRICRIMLRWIAACVIALFGATSAWMGSNSSTTSGPGEPAMNFTEPDAPQAAPVAPQLNGDGVLDTPGVVARLVPALANEMTGAVKNGDARETLGQFCRWIISGEALHSQSFWLFWSVMGLGVVAVMCCSLVDHFMQWRHHVEARTAGAAGFTVPSDETKEDSTPQ